jgi:hypothetical protein
MLSVQQPPIFGSLKTGSITPDDIRSQLGQNADVKDYWSMCMDTLKEALANAKESFVTISDQHPGLFKVKMDKFESHLAGCGVTSDDMGLSPTEFYTKFFSTLVNPDYLVPEKDSKKPSSKKRKVGWRKLYEKISASKQCEIAKVRPELTFTDWNTCYICGQPLLDRYSTPNAFPLNISRECEHVINAFTALGYKSLIQSANEQLLKTDGAVDFLKREYAYAHQCCNQIKSDDKWITSDDENPYSYIVDKKALLATLKSINKEILSDPLVASYDCASLAGIDVEERANSITVNYLNPLLEVINRDAQDYESTYNVFIRINQIRALSLNMDSIVHCILHGEPIKTTKNSVYRLKEAITFCKKAYSSKEKSNESIYLRMFTDIHSCLTQDDKVRLKDFTDNLYATRLTTENGVRVAKKIWENQPGLEQRGQEIRNGLLVTMTQIYEGDGEIRIEIDKIFEFLNFFTQQRNIGYLEAVKTFFVLVEDYRTPTGIGIDLTNIKLRIDKIEKTYTESIKGSRERIVEGGFDDPLELPIVGGSKNIIKGGTKLTKEELDELLEEHPRKDNNIMKDCLVKLALSYNVDPNDYGIRVQTTSSGRFYTKPIKLSYIDMNGTRYQTVKVGEYDYIVYPPTSDYPNGYLSNKDGTSIIRLEWLASSGRGFYTQPNEDGRAYFYSIGGKRKNKRHSISNKKIRTNKKSLKRKTIKKR